MFTRAFLASLFALAMLRPASAAAEDINVADTVVAVVNNETISQKDVLERAMPIISTLDKEMSVADRQKRVREILAAACHSIVHEKLMINEANRLFKANEELKKRIGDRLKERIEEETRRAGGEAQFREALQKQNLTYSDFTDRFRKRIMQEFVLYQFVQRDVSTSPREVMDFYSRNKDQFKELPKTTYRQIFVRAGDKRSRSEALSLINRIRGRILTENGDFVQLAKEYSEDGKNGETWDFTATGSRPKAIEEALQTLTAGQVSDRIETEIGFTIIRVESRKAGGVRTLEEAQSDIEKRLNRDKMDKRYEALIKRLESENYVSYLSFP